MKPFPLVRNKRKLSTLFTLTLHSLRILRALREEEEIKGIKIGKKEVKLSQLAGDMTLCLKDPENSIKNS
jgi:hypothetical protein